MKEGDSPIMTFEETVIAFRGMYIRNTAYIPPNWKDIRIADIKIVDTNKRKVVE